MVKPGEQIGLGGEVAHIVRVVSESSESTYAVTWCGQITRYWRGVWAIDDTPPGRTCRRCAGLRARAGVA